MKQYLAGFGILLVQLLIVKFSFPFTANFLKT